MTNNIQNKLRTLKALPHIIVCEIWEDYAQKKEETYIVKLKTGSVIYKLDSIVIRTTNGEHFGSTITCNNQELVFDNNTLDTKESTFFVYDDSNNDISYECQPSVTGNSKFKSCGPPAYYTEFKA